MLTDTNNMFSNRVLRKILRETKIMDLKHIHKITFKKPKQFKKEMVCKSYAIYNVKNKFVIYIKPYPFYMNSVKALQTRTVSCDGIDYHSRITERICHHLYNILSNASIQTHDVGIKLLFEDFQETIRIVKESRNYFPINMKGNVYDNYWAISKFYRTNVLKNIWKNNKTDGYSQFQYSMARIIRVMRNKWVGKYTFIELKRKIFGDENIKLYSDYKLKKIFNTIHEPIKCKNRFNPNARTYNFYDDTHLNKFNKKYSTEIKLAKDMHKIYIKEIGGL